MTDESKEKPEVKQSAHCVQNANAMPPRAEKPRACATENAPAPAGENSRGGVGVSDLASSTGVAIYSDGAPEKKSNAYGVNKNSAWPAPGKLIAIADPIAAATACGGEGIPAAGVKHESSVCESAQVGKTKSTGCFDANAVVGRLWGADGAVTREEAMLATSSRLHDAARCFAQCGMKKSAKMLCEMADFALKEAHSARLAREMVESDARMAGKDRA